MCFAIISTSGAPIVNSSGEVVCLNIGGGEQFGKMTGIANSCTSMKKMIKEALSEAGGSSHNE